MPIVEQMRHPTEAELERAQMFSHLRPEAVIYYDSEATNKLGRDYWRLVTDVKFYVGDRSDNVWVYIPRGFLTDGATVPRLFWWLVPPLGRHGLAAIVHDYLCEHETLYTEEGLTQITRAEADKIFNEAMRVSQVNRLVRYTMYAAVRLYAFFSKKSGRTASIGYRARKFGLEEAWRLNPPEFDSTHELVFPVSSD